MSETTTQRQAMTTATDRESDIHRNDSAQTHGNCSWTRLSRAAGLSVAVRRLSGYSGDRLHVIIVCSDDRSKMQMNSQGVTMKGAASSENGVANGVVM